MIIVLSDPPSTHSFLGGLSEQDRLCLLTAHEQFVSDEKLVLRLQREHVRSEKTLTTQTAMANVRKFRRGRDREKEKDKQRERASRETALCEPTVLRTSVYEKFLRSLEYLYNSHDVAALLETVIFPCHVSDVQRRINIRSSHADESYALSFPYSHSHTHSHTHCAPFLASAVSPLGAAAMPLEMSIAFSGHQSIKNNFDRVFTASPDCFVVFGAPSTRLLPDGKTLLRYDITFFCTLPLLLPADSASVTASERDRESETASPAVPCSPCTTDESEAESVREGERAIKRESFPPPPPVLHFVRMELQGYNESIFDENNKILTSIDTHVSAHVSPSTVTSAQVFRAFGY